MAERSPRPASSRLASPRPASPRVVAYTSFTYAYLSRDLVLAETLRAAHPDWELHALLVDRPPEGTDPPPLDAFDAVVFADELGVAGFRGWMFRHDIVEACTAVKGRMLCRLLDEGAEAVFYFDPDIAVFHPMGELLAGLDDASVLLTPHQLDPNDEPAAVADNELASMRYGSYNLGFLGVANDADGRAFARWWDGHLTRACYDEPENGIFTDQKYCDLAPSLFERVRVVRDPGCNVASWNLSRRRLAVTARGELTSNRSLLKFYHFTKIFGPGLMMTDRYCEGNTVAIELCNWYRARVEHFAAALPSPPGWVYDRFGNGVAIPRAARVLYRRRPDLMARFDDPFEAEAASFLDWLRRETPALLDADGR